MRRLTLFYRYRCNIHRRNFNFFTLIKDILHYKYKKDLKLAPPRNLTTPCLWWFYLHQMSRV